MKRRSTRKRKTDYGTVLLHGCLVAALIVAVSSGLRIATESPDRTWINVLDAVLPQAGVWVAHMQAGLALVAVGIAYAIYLPLASLVRRVRFDRVRAVGLLGRPHARWEGINVLLSWILYALLLLQLMTGGSMYFGSGTGIAARLHWIGMWVVLGWTMLHVAVHWRLGRWSQLSRVLRPARLPPSVPPLDPADALAMLEERPARLAVAPGWEPHAWETRHPDASATCAHGELRSEIGGARRRGRALHANPLVVAAAAAMAGVSFILVMERGAGETLHVRRISAAEAPVIDGEISDAVWRRIAPVHVPTGQGGNFDGKGETTVAIRAVHDGVWCYFLFVWDDPTRSLKQLPLIKRHDGWHLLHDGYESGDERSYNEDKLAVLLTRLDVVLAGDRTFHAGPTPAAGKPRTLSGRGLHFTTDENLYVDVWQWKATSTGPAGYLDDSHFGPPDTPTKVQSDGRAPYRGGFASDPGAAAYLDNFEPQSPEGYAGVVVPRRLPRDVVAMAGAMRQVDLDPNQSESDGARWYLTEADSAPYSADIDARIPVGTVIPGVIITGSYSGDRADVRGAARWAAGRWALEVARRLDTDSPYDTPISSGTFMRVAAFDHAQIRHTRHIRPIRLEVD